MSEPMAGDTGHLALSIPQPTLMAMTNAVTKAMATKQIRQIRLRGDRSLVGPTQGDLLFGNRLSSLQMVMNLSADQWTHVALAIRSRGELRTIEVGPQGCFSRPVADFLGAYRFVGLARPLMSARCRDLVMTTSRFHLADDDVTYSWPYCALVASTSLLRRFAPGAVEPRVVDASLRAAIRLERQSKVSDATCSSFIASLLDAACPRCRLDVRWPSRRRVPPWRPRPTVTDVSGADTATRAAALPGARTLVAPSDLWVAAGFALRAVIGTDGTTVLCDLTPCDLTPYDLRGGDDMNPNPNPNPKQAA